MIIAGAGPTGLTSACGLRAHGVQVQVVDKALEPARTSRANVLHARGVEVLDRLGALGDLPKSAVTAMTITTYVGSRPLSIMRFGNASLGTARPAILVSQAVVEGELRRRLMESGGMVEWNTAVVDAVQDSDGVSVTLGDRRVVRAGWLVGCDGAHSVVRKLAGIGFPGAPVADGWLMADVHLDWDMDRSGSHGWLHRDGIFGAVPMRHFGAADDVWRLMAYRPGAIEGDLDTDQVLDRFRALIPKRTGRTEARLHGAVWTSVFRVHRRLASDYRHGRFLIAGDAAHIHSPLGGQGMLTGMGDAENVAWKLALVIQGRAAESLLDTYQSERRPLAVGVVRRTSTNTRLQVGDGAAVRLLRERIIVPLFNRPSVQRWATRLASQLWVSYRKGPLGGNRLGRRPRPGDRVPDRECRRSDGRATRLYTELGGHWALLTSSGVHVDTALGENLVILTAADLGDSMLVRPDGHLAWHGDLTSGDLQKWLTGALQQGRVQ